jgi:hypothetical protein
MDKNSEISLEDVTFPNDESATFNLGNPKWKYHFYASGIITIKEINMNSNFRRYIDVAVLFVEEDEKFKAITRMVFSNGDMTKSTVYIEKDNVGNIEYLLEPFEIIKMTKVYSKDKTAKSLWEEMLNNPDMKFSVKKEEKN